MCSCGNYGFILLWESIPPRKLCEPCNKCLLLGNREEAISRLGLGFRDRQTLPILGKDTYVVLDCIEKEELSRPSLFGFWWIRGHPKKHWPTLRHITLGRITTWYQFCGCLLLMAKVA